MDISLTWPPLPTLPLLVALAVLAVLAAAAVAAGYLWHRRRRSARHAASATAPLRKGDRMPSFVAAALNGVPVPSSLLFADGQGMLLVFAHADCAISRALVDLLVPRCVDGDKLVVILHGAPVAPAMKPGPLPRHTVLVQQGDDVSRRFGIATLPAAARVRWDGTLASPVAAGTDAVLRLAHWPVARSPRRPRVSVLP